MFKRFILVRKIHLPSAVTNAKFAGGKTFLIRGDICRGVIILPSRFGTFASQNETKQNMNQYNSNIFLL